LIVVSRLQGFLFSSSRCLDQNTDQHCCEGRPAFFSIPQGV
uniref:Uncharacterized protein n=1 Tax=Rodentolepis nana TaxID=102285 RepID=A0A0R3TDJ0_RODNA